MGTTQPDGVIREVPYGLLRNFNTGLGRMTVVIAKANGQVREWPILSATFERGIPFYDEDRVQVILAKPAYGGVRLCDLWSVNPATGAEAFDSSLSLTAARQAVAHVYVSSVSGHYGLVSLAPSSITGASGYRPGDGLNLNSGDYTSVASGTVASCQLSSLVVQTAGSNYLINDPIILAGTTSGTVTVSRAQATSVSVSGLGGGYAVSERVTLAGGTPLSPTVLNVGEVQAYTATMSQSGTGYTPLDAVTLNGGVFTEAAQVVVDSCKVETASVIVSGSLYQVGDLLEVSGGAGSTRARLQVATINGTTGVATVTPSIPGDYTTLATNYVSTTAATGTGDNAATFDLVWGISTASVRAIAKGTYTATPANVVAQASSTGTGGNALFSVSWAPYTGTVTAAGSYTALPSNPVSQASSTGAGSGATWTAAWGVNGVTVSSAGSVQAVPANPMAQNYSTGTGFGATFYGSWAPLGITAAAVGDYATVPTNPITPTTGGNGSGATVDATWTIISGGIAKSVSYS